MKNLCPKVLCEKSRDIFEKYKIILDKYVSHVLLLAVRVLVALVFYKSGMTKIANMEQTVFLFKYEYALPFISPVLAAYSATFFELVCSVLLIAGLFTRVAALPLLIMTIVIQTLVFQNPEHFYWMALLGVVAVYGGGKLSLECLFCKLCSKCKSKCKKS